MTISQMLEQSGLLTLLGMAVVFSFIIILIISMNLLKVAVHALKLDKEDVKSVAKAAPRPAAVAAAKPAVDHKAIIAAIAAAVHEKESC